MKKILKIFPRKFLFGANGWFWAKRDMEIILMVFLEKKFNLGQFGHFGPKMVHPHNFGSASDFF